MPTSGRFVRHPVVLNQIVAEIVGGTATGAVVPVDFARLEDAFGVEHFEGCELCRQWCEEFCSGLRLAWDIDDTHSHVRFHPS